MEVKLRQLQRKVKNRCRIHNWENEKRVDPNFKVNEIFIKLNVLGWRIHDFVWVLTWAASFAAPKMAIFSDLCSERKTIRQSKGCKMLKMTEKWTEKWVQSWPKSEQYTMNRQKMSKNGLESGKYGLKSDPKH